MMNLRFANVSLSALLAPLVLLVGCAADGVSAPVPSERAAPTTSALTSDNDPSACGPAMVVCPLTCTGGVCDTETNLCGDSALTTTGSGGTCAPIVSSWTSEGNLHVAEGSATSYCTLPASSGNHYPIWAKYGTYTGPVATGYLVHNLEHGAVVISYKCPDNTSAACAKTEADLQALVDSRTDPTCEAAPGGAKRIIIVPDPTLDVAVAAASWTWTYRAGCVDGKSLLEFVDAHYGRGREAVCSDGIVPP